MQVTHSPIRNGHHLQTRGKQAQDKTGCILACLVPTAALYIVMTLRSGAERREQISGPTLCRSSADRRLHDLICQGLLSVACFQGL